MVVKKRKALEGVHEVAFGRTLSAPSVFHEFSVLWRGCAAKTAIDILACWIIVEAAGCAQINAGAVERAASCHPVCSCNWARWIVDRGDAVVAAIVPIIDPFGNIPGHIHHPIGTGTF